MGFHRGPKPVTDGLVLYYDPDNNKSIVSGSSSITDLSRNGNDGSLINTAQLIEDSINYIELDGDSDTIDFEYDLRQNYTFQCWVNIDTVDGFCFLGQGTTSVNNGLHVWYRSGTAIRFGLYSNDVDATGLTTNTGEWYQYTFTYNHSTSFRQIFRNGNLLDSGNGDGTAYEGTGTARIGAIYSSATSYADGRYSCCRLYNRVLESKEIKQNFNAQKSRFGL